MKCLNCQKVLKGNQKKYCSRKCGVVYINRNRYKTDKEYRDKLLFGKARRSKMKQIDKKILNLNYKIEKLRKETDIFLKQVKSFEALKEKLKKM